MTKNLSNSFTWRIIAIALTITLGLFSMAANAQDTRPLCAGKTKAGIACKSHAQANSTYCGAHNPNVVRCGFVKKDGNKCQMRVKSAGTRCHHHAGK